MNHRDGYDRCHNGRTIIASVSTMRYCVTSDKEKRVVLARHADGRIIARKCSAGG